MLSFTNSTIVAKFYLCLSLVTYLPPGFSMMLCQLYPRAPTTLDNPSQPFCTKPPTPASPHHINISYQQHTHWLSHLYTSRVNFPFLLLLNNNSNSYNIYPCFLYPEQNDFSTWPLPLLPSPSCLTLSHFHLIHISCLSYIPILPPTTPSLNPLALTLLFITYLPNPNKYPITSPVSSLYNKISSPYWLWQS